MTDDRSLERAARSWVEEGPSRAPDYAVAAALARIQTTPQERDLRIPWRPRTMFDRLAAAAIAGVLAIGTLTLGYSLFAKPPGPAACPAPQREADAIDAGGPGAMPGSRAWSDRGGVPRTRAGRLAVFATNPPDNDPGTLLLLDPMTGERCVLVALSSNHPIQGPFGTSLDWSPSGDALAIGLAGAEAPDGSGQEDGVVLVWTPDRILRVWSGEGMPQLEWAPDGRSLAVWADATTDLRIIPADGSADRTYPVNPALSGLTWSPDGTRIFVAEAVEEDIAPDTALSLVDVREGRVTPLGDFGAGHFRPVAWLDDDRVLINRTERGRGVTGWFTLSTSDPSALRDVAFPEDVPNLAVPSPDRTRLLYLAGGDRGEVSVVSLSGPGGEPPLRLAPGLRAGPFGLAWSPDGLQAVFLVAEGGLWTVQADGTGLRQVASSGVIPVDDPWQPDPVR